VILSSLKEGNPKNQTRYDLHAKRIRKPQKSNQTTIFIPSELVQCMKKDTLMWR
jgi:hypothetical protein